MTTQLHESSTGLRPLSLDEVCRDLADLVRLARPDAFRQLLRLIAGQAGRLVNLSEWASVLGIGRETVVSYLEVLETSHIILDRKSTRLNSSH